MTSNVKSFIEKYVELIDSEDFVQLYKHAWRELSHENTDDLTRSLHDIDIYPEMFMSELPERYIDCYPENAFEDYLDAHPILFNHLLSRTDKHDVIGIAKKYNHKKYYDSVYNVENPPPFVYTKSNSVFYNFVRNYVTELIIDDSVISIPPGAFLLSPKLEKVTFGKKIKKIGSASFSECPSLKEIIIPNTVVYVADEAFRNDIGLTKIQFSGNQTEITPQTCAKCINLKEVIIPNTITLIDNGAFKDCVSLTNINIPDSVEIIGPTAFRGSGLTSINLNKVASVGANAFEFNADLSHIDFGTNIHKIDNRAFANCPNLIDVILPTTLIELGNACFADCNKSLVVKYHTPAADAKWSLNWNMKYKTQRIE